MKYEACSIPEKRSTGADEHAHAYVNQIIKFGV